MVRVNIINPRNLADQHLIAEYQEIIMLLGYVKKHPKTSLDKIPANYLLGPGHILFFKNKLKYLKNRHEQLRKEMQKRGFQPKKKISLMGLPKEFVRNWSPTDKDKQIIKKRLIERVSMKPSWYTYYREHKSKEFLANLIKKG
ncbi:MAG TPA: pyrimidine dimer DNA glycosylase/endonuclease V [Candidatus Nanoarchaeia archaeon]|nr:pyrimidine dimer DNA glycosylase/endonuclease V [Candidatus Nanoarchaeia archaeon]